VEYMVGVGVWCLCVCVSCEGVKALKFPSIGSCPPSVVLILINHMRYDG
jgi:hypothetical protein